MSDTTVLLDGLCFPEASRWHDESFWFSDMHAKRVIRAGLDGRAHRGRSRGASLGARLAAGRSAAHSVDARPARSRLVPIGSLLGLLRRRCGEGGYVLQGALG